MPGSLREGLTAKTRIRTLFRAHLLQPPQPEASGCCHHWPQHFSPGAMAPAPLSSSMPGVGEIAQAVLAAPPLGVGWFSPCCTQAAQFPGHCFQKWCDSLGTLPLCVPFSGLGADTKALTQVRKRPGLRTLELFLGIQLQGTCFHREENEEEKAANNHHAIVRTSPYLH